MSATLAVPLGARDHIVGPPNAPVTLLEYGDFECPYCGRAHPIVKAVVKSLGKRLRFAFRHFPLAKIHPHALHAAEMAEAAGKHGLFWQMHDALFENQAALEDDDLVTNAAALGIDPEWAATALAEGLFREKVQEDFMSGVRSGVNGTPTFFINGLRYDGSWDAASLLEALERAALAPR